MITLRYYVSYRWKTDSPRNVYVVWKGTPHLLVKFMAEMFKGSTNVEVRRVWEER